MYRFRKTRVAWNISGHAHFLTYSCLHRWPLLTPERSRSWVIDSIAEARSKLDLLVWAYVIMPEHVHVLVLPQNERATIPRILTALKQSVSARARLYLVSRRQEAWLDRLTVSYRSRSKFRFWQPGGGFDRNLTTPESIAEIMDYIHLNPVRRGLVKRSEDWRWSSGTFWNGDRNPVLSMDALI